MISASFAFIASGAVGDHEDWVQTYPDGSKRGRYAGTGMKYDRTLDKFITSKPYPSWTLNSGGNWEIHQLHIHLPLILQNICGMRTLHHGS